MVNGPDRTERELRFYGTPLSFYSNGIERLRLDPTAGQVIIMPQGAVGDEGGEIQLKGAGSWPDIQFDSWQGNPRLHTLASGKEFIVIGGNGVRAVNFLYSSDARLKKDVHDLGSERGLAAILRLRPVSFRWKDRAPNDDAASLGFIAQDVEAVLPDLVSEDQETGTLSIGYGGLTAPIVKAIQELKVDNDNLRSEIVELRHTVEGLSAAR